jgi:hypothetical protein
VHHYEVSISGDRSWLIPESRRKAFDEIEQTLTTRRDMSAVLNVVGGPIALGRYVVTFVEQRVERLQNKPFIFLNLNCSCEIPFSNEKLFYPGNATEDLRAIGSIRDTVPSVSLKNSSTCCRNVLAC